MPTNKTVILCYECRHFKPFPDGTYGECHRLAKNAIIVKKTDFCSYAQYRESCGNTTGGKKNPNK